MAIDCPHSGTCSSLLIGRRHHQTYCASTESSTGRCLSLAHRFSNHHGPSLSSSATCFDLLAAHSKLHNCSTCQAFPLFYFLFSMVSASSTSLNASRACSTVFTQSVKSCCDFAVSGPVGRVAASTTYSASASTR